ncbi:MAG: response regulator transcription factor, partial [Coprobacillaceae bacterium]
MHKILIIEDDMTIAKTLASHLSQWEYKVEYITDFKNVMEFFTSFDPQLVLLDISLPLFNGYHWCQEIRNVSKIPIIFISSQEENMNIIMAMNMGADDFITKPFDLQVLTAKIQAILRRSYSFVNNTNIITYEDVILNCNNATLSYHEQNIELTKNEFKILQSLLEKPCEIISRDQIMMTLWQSDEFIDDNTLTVNV